jgi:tRNA-dihydrouridine synthase
MIGRGALHNPKVFNRVSDEMETGDRLTMLDQHLRLWRTTWGSQKNFSVFKKYLKVYVNGFDGAAQMREMLMVAADEGTLENQLVQLRHQAGT